MPPFTPKTWHDSPDPSTPIDAAALTDLEQRIAAFAAERGKASRFVTPPPKRQATLVTTTDDPALTGITGTAGAFSHDPAVTGLGGNGSIKLVAPVAAGGSNEVVVPLTGAPWNFGDGITPTGYLRAWFMLDDSRDKAVSSLSYLRMYLATDAGFANCIYQEVGKPTNPDNAAIKNRMMAQPVCLPMLLSDDVGSSDMPPKPNSGSAAWQDQGTGFVTADWSAISQVRLRISGSDPGDGSPYVPPTVWFLGIEFVPLPPKALCTLQFDWSMPGHVSVGTELFARYGVVPQLNLFPYVFTGGQGSTEMNLDQVLAGVRERHFETSIYDIPQTVADGINNFGGGDYSTVAGVPWSLRSKAQVEEDIAEAQAYFKEYNLGGWDHLQGQARKLYDHEGQDLYRRYASFGIVPVATDYMGWWPPDDPYRQPTYMVTTSDVVDNGDGTWSAAPAMQRRVRRAVKNGEWLRLLIHAVTPDGSNGMSQAQLIGLFDYITGAGRFDGTSGLLVSQSEALAMTRYAA